MLYNEPDNNLMNNVIPKDYKFKNTYEKYMKEPFLYLKIFFNNKKFSWNNMNIYHQ